MARWKKKRQVAHAKRRAEERHGLRLNKFALRAIVHQIQTNKAKFVESQSHRVKKFLVTVDGKEVLAVYDKKSHTVITFLPENARELQASG